VIGAFLYESWDIRAPRVLKKRDGRFWTLYGCYPKRAATNSGPATRAWLRAMTAHMDTREKVLHPVSA